MIHCKKVFLSKKEKILTYKLTKFSSRRGVELEKNPKIDSALKFQKFTPKHIGPTDAELQEMLGLLKVNNTESLMKETLPEQIFLSEDAKQRQVDVLGEPISEEAALRYIKSIAQENKVCKNYIGLGFHPVIVPPVVLRNVLENPGWYTSYTPYQSEISQGRLESLLNFQTLISELTGLPFSNASLLDEATAVCEAMYMAHSLRNDKRKTFFVSDRLFPFLHDAIKTRAHYMGIKVITGREEEIKQILAQNGEVFGGIVQNPNDGGQIQDYKSFTNALREHGATSVVTVDPLSLLLCESPGKMGFDIAVGSAQRLGVPMMNGGPHAGFLASKEEFKRKIPGRIVGMSKDKHGNPAYRLAMQTREQHIRRDKATSNICTAQALLANMAAFYALFHGKRGLIAISTRVHLYATVLARYLKSTEFSLVHAPEEIFDTVTVDVEDSQSILELFRREGINVRYCGESVISIAINEATSLSDLETLLDVFAEAKSLEKVDIAALVSKTATWEVAIDPSLLRDKENFLNQDIFNSFSSETQLLRYIWYLQKKDLSLVHSMISLGSCTMKMNATSELIPVTWPEFSEIHPFAPQDQLLGYRKLIEEFNQMLQAITLFDGVSLQPNSGANGEFAGLIAIRRYNDSIGEGHRNVCLIPSSAHGTNPASATLAGLKVVVVETEENGNISLEDLRKKAELHSKNLCALMVTYPSTFGVFEQNIKEITLSVHRNGGQVYMDGANMNAQCMLTSPATIGADVCHLNLHKTFCIPHGGGGPGIGPICVKKHLTPFLPGHVETNFKGNSMHWSTTSAPFGSAGILPISYMYVKMLARDLLKATHMAILNANYMVQRLKASYKVLYLGKGDRCAHEFIIDLRAFKKTLGITEEDVAKRLADYSFHAPTMSFPVPGTLMIEPTESEDKQEIDRFCDALIEIRNEIREVEQGRYDKKDNVLKNAPHSLEHVTGDNWEHAYSREKAAYPLAYLKKREKFWPSVGRVDNVYGDLNLVCTCPSINDYI